MGNSLIMYDVAKILPIRMSELYEFIQISHLKKVRMTCHGFGLDVDNAVIY